MSSFVERFKEFVYEGKSSISDISAKYDIDLSSIYSWLREETTPSLTNLINIADEYMCSLEYLIGRKELESGFVPNLNRKPFPEQFVLIMKEKHVSEYRLAKETEISRNSIAKWRSGERLPHLSNLIVVAEYLDITLDYLTDRE